MVGSDLAQRGYSRDSRPECKQVCIALVVTKEGLPLGYEVFAGNRHDSTTVEEVVGKMEQLYGKAGRIWVMERGMVSGENLAALQMEGRRYIIGAPKATLKRFGYIKAICIFDRYGIIMTTGYRHISSCAFLY